MREEQNKRLMIEKNRGSPVVNFINVLRDRYSFKIFGAKISNIKASFVQNFGAKKSAFVQKCACKILMKLTLCVSLKLKGD